MADRKKAILLYPQSDMIARVLSSVGSEHLVYTQRVGGSTPSGPTFKEVSFRLPFFVLKLLLVVGELRTKRDDGSEVSFKNCAFGFVVVKKARQVGQNPADRYGPPDARHSDAGNSGQCIGQDDTASQGDNGEQNG